MGNLPLETYVQKHDDFYGRIIEQMPLLIAQGRTPLSVAGLMLQRIQALNQPKDVKNAWWNNHFHLGDAILYHPNGKIKIELDSQLLRQLTPESRCQDGLLLIDNATYTASQGKEFNRDELPLNTPLNKTAILAHPLWNYLAREDQELLKDYTEALFEEGKQFNYDDSNMGIYLRGAPKSIPLAGAWCVDWISNRSNLDGDGNLGFSFGGGRLVGVAPEAHGGKTSCAKRTAQKQAPALDLILRTIEPFIAPVNHKKIENILRRHYKRYHF